MSKLDESMEMGATTLQRQQLRYYQLLHHSSKVEFEYVPMQFYIFQVEGASLVHGVLRIELPRSTRVIFSSSQGVLAPDTLPRNPR